MRPTPPALRGLGLVELMVALALGLGLIAATGAFLVHQTAMQAQLLAEARVMQDLDAAIALVARGVRRAGHDGQLGADGTASVYAANRRATLTVDTRAQTLGYAHDRSTRPADPRQAEAVAAASFRLRDGVLQLRDGAGSWQAVTDPATLSLQRFSLVPRVTALALDAGCVDDGDCLPGAPRCARVLRRELDIELAGATVKAPVRPVVARRSVVLRNDVVETVPCAS